MILTLLAFPRLLELLLGTVHTRGESLQGWLGDVWTCRMILASAYVLRLKSKILGQKTTYILSNTRKLNRVSSTN